MSSAVTKPVSITVSDAIRVAGLLKKPPHARACYVLAHGAGAGMDHPFMGRCGAGTCGARRCHIALPVSLHGARQQATRSAATCASDGARGSDRGVAPVARTCTHRRRKIVWRLDGLASTGECSTTGRKWVGIPGISAAPGRLTIARPRRASVQRADPDALLTRYPRQLGVARPASNRSASSLASPRRSNCLRMPIIHFMCRRGRGGRMAEVLEDMLDALTAWLEGVVLRTGKSLHRVSQPHTCVRS